MADTFIPEPTTAANSIGEAVCIHTSKIYDACKDKDCVENIRLHTTCEVQDIIDQAVNIKCGQANLLWVYVDVDPVPFNKGFYAVDVRFFYRIAVHVFTCIGKPVLVTGLGTFDKRVILFGSEGNSKIYSSKMMLCCADEETVRSAKMPTAVCEVVDPILLDAKLVDPSCQAVSYRSTRICDIPPFICGFFDDELLDQTGRPFICVTLGQFSIIRLERDNQLVVPCYDFCIPEKESICSLDDSPCELFERIQFPVDEFFPPHAKTAYRPQDMPVYP
ncbi:MAG: hypothetical protein LBK75_06635 [Oscillospiraceae bacterium]|jgi:hypothetical protein|nr:hypothetical protein [Oscillospiraceae bacterium]